MQTIMKKTIKWRQIRTQLGTAYISEDGRFQIYYVHQPYNTHYVLLDNGASIYTDAVLLECQQMAEHRKQLYN